MPAPDTSLAAAQDLADFLRGVPPTDPRLLAALRAASRRFRGAVRHPVSLVTGDTVTLDGTGEQVLRLPAAPVLAVTEVAIDGAAVTDWRVKKRAGLIQRTGCAVWPNWAEITVTYDHGHDPVPQEIQEAVIDQARALYRLEPGVQTLQAGGESTTYGLQAAIGVTAQWVAAVEAYRLNRGDDA